MNLTAVLIPVYLAAVIAIVVISGRKSKTFKDYALADGKLPWFVLTGTIIASLIGGGTMMGYVGSFYTYGVLYFWMFIALFAAQIVMAYFIAARVRRLKVYSIADIFSKRYGKAARLISGIINMIVGIAVGFAMLSSFSTLLSGYVGIDKNWAMIIGVLLFAITATLGGFKGVAITDAIQAVLIIGGALVVSVTAFQKSGGFAGWSALPSDMLSLTAPTLPFLTFAGSVISAFGMGLADQAVMFQRINAAKNPKDANRATRTAAWLALLCFVLIAAMGISARVILPEGLGGNDVIVELLKTVSPAVGALYSAAIIAAVLTTANSMYLSASMSFSHDLLKAVFPKISDKAQVIAGKLFVWIAAVISYFVIKFQPSIMTWIMLGYACITCMIIPLYGGLLSKKATPASGALSLGLSIIGVVAWEFLKSPFGINSVFVALILGILGFVAGFGIKAGVKQEQIEMVDQFKSKVKATDD